MVFPLKGEMVWYTLGNTIGGGGVFLACSLKNLISDEAEAFCAVSESLSGCVGGDFV
jgi:hypothetical protein